MRAVLAVSLLLCASAARGECTMALPPPPEFDHPYRGELLEYPLGREEIPAACAELLGGSADSRVSGCGVEVREVSADRATILRRYGLIVYPVRCAAIRRHELGHANGWAHRH